MIITNTELAAMMAKEGFDFDNALRIIDTERTPADEKLHITIQYIEDLRLDLQCREEV